MTTAGKLVPFANLVINIDSGNIISLVIDNVCNGCDSGNCILSKATLDATLTPTGAEISQSNACSIATADASESQSNFKVFVTWAGTDTNGNYCKTAGLRMSQFAGSSISEMWRWVSGSSYSTS